MSKPLVAIHFGDSSDDDDDDEMVVETQPPPNLVFDDDDDDDDIFAHPSPRTERGSIDFGDDDDDDDDDDTNDVVVSNGTLTRTLANLQLESDDDDDDDDEFIVQARRRSPLADAVNERGNLDDGDDVSASDSLVRIRAEERALVDRDRLRASRAATDQVSRIVDAHRRAMATRSAALEADASESTAERAATGARTAAMPSVVFAAAAASPLADANDTTRRAVRMPEPRVAGDVNTIFAGVDGHMPPLDIHDNYALLARQIVASLRAGNAPTSGQAGSLVRTVATRLMRELPDRLTGTAAPRPVTSLASPMLNTFMAKLISDTAHESSIPPHMNDPNNPMLQRIRQSLRVSTRVHEETMMRPPAANEPACACGAECAANKIVCQGGGMTWVAFYYVDEWQAYRYDVENGVPDARLPNLDRPCILCMRTITNMYYMAVRTQKVQLSLDPVSDGAYPAIIQPHHNLPTEYPLEACHVPVSTKYEGLVYPIVRPCLTCFAQSFDAHGNIVYRQLIPWPSALPSAPPTPHVRVRPTSGLGASTPASLSF
jgi:hypothetical protein